MIPSAEGRSQPGGIASIRDVPDQAWTSLGTRRLFFGHQSVGENILDGVADIARDDPRVALRVCDAGPTMGGAGGTFGHRRIGRNGDPWLKTDEFAAWIDLVPAGRIDLAFHKYCYADIDGGSNVDALFEHYQRSLRLLAARHPEIVFVHVTAPLQGARPGPRATISRWLGRRGDRFADNRARDRFNRLLRRRYQGRDPLFDLAAVESTRPDGSGELMSSADGSAPALVSDYASDGSHLNALGRRRVAAALLIFLAGLSTHGLAGGVAAASD